MTVNGLFGSAPRPSRPLFEAREKAPLFTPVDSTAPLFGGAGAAPSAPLFGGAGTTGPVAEPQAPTPPQPQVLAQQADTSAYEAALAALPGPAAAAFRELFDALPDVHDDLNTLLTNGTMAQPSVAERLDEMLNEKRGAGMSSQEVTAQVVSMLADPDTQIFQGLNTYTCAATNIQRELADSPAEFIALVDGLTSKAGKAKVGDLELTRLDASLDRDKSARNLVNRVVQGALMSEGGGGYDVAKDEVAGGGSGLTLFQTAQLTAQIERQGQLGVAHNGDTHAQFAPLFEQATDIPIGVTWNNQPHMLLLRGSENGVSTYFNPQDHTEGQMPTADLLFKTEGAVFPDALLQSIQFPYEQSAYAPYGGKS